MRVVRNGNLREKEYQCTECNTLMAYNRYDIRDIRMSDNGIDKIRGITCPTCSHVIILLGE